MLRRAVILVVFGVPGILLVGAGMLAVMLWIEAS